MPNLPTLLQEYKAQLNASFADLEKRTGIPKQTVAWIAQQGDRTFTIDPDRIQALATGLGAPVDEVKIAAIESSGLMPRELAQSARVHILGADLEALPDEDWHLVRSLVRRLARGDE